MKYIETHVGHITEIIRSEEFSVNDWLLIHNINLSNAIEHDKYTLYRDHNGKPRFIVTKSDEMFIINDTETRGDNISLLTKKCINEYDFVLRFYNGETNFEKVLTSELNRIKW